MKVEQNKPEPQFYPVTITLESQFEVDVLASLVGKVMGSGKVDKFMYNLYDKLDDLSQQRLNYFSNTIAIVEDIK